MQCEEIPELKSTQIRLAGGWVRDKLMGRESSDVDIALDNIKGERTLLPACTCVSLPSAFSRVCQSSSGLLQGHVPRKFAGLVPSTTSAPQLPVVQEDFTVGVIQENPEQSKHLATATFKLCGVSIDANNLRAEEYADTRIPTVVWWRALRFCPFLLSDTLPSAFAAHRHSRGGRAPA